MDVAYYKVLFARCLRKTTNALSHSSLSHGRGLKPEIQEYNATFYGEVLVDKGAMYIRVTLYGEYLIIL